MKCNMNHRDSYKWPDCGPDRDDYNKYYPKPHPKSKTETIVKCGTSIGSIPLCTNGVLAGRLTNGTALVDSCPTVIASVTLDTSELVNPTTKIDFSSQISWRTVTGDPGNFSLRLLFKLSKICGGSRIPLGTWTYEQTRITPGAPRFEGAFEQHTDSFSFSICECDDCPDCCRYVIEVVDQDCYNIDFAIVSNISISATAEGEVKRK